MSGVLFCFGAQIEGYAWATDNVGLWLLKVNDNFRCFTSKVPIFLRSVQSINACHMGSLQPDVIVNGEYLMSRIMLKAGTACLFRVVSVTHRVVQAITCNPCFWLNETPTGWTNARGSVTTCDMPRVSVSTHLLTSVCTRSKSSSMYVERHVLFFFSLSSAYGVVFLRKSSSKETKRIMVPR